MSKVAICKFKDWMGWINLYNHFDLTLTIVSPYGTKIINEVQRCPSTSCKYIQISVVPTIQ